MTPWRSTSATTRSFVIGSPRSGTTALAFALGQHPDLATFGRVPDPGGPLLPQQGARPQLRARGSSWLRHQGIPPEEFLADVGLGFNRLFTRVGGRQALGGSHAAPHPDAAVAAGHVPRGTLRAHPARRPPGGALHGQLRAPSTPRGQVPWWAGDFAKACKTWARFTTAAVEFRRPIPDRCLTVRNEDLVADPAAGFRRLLAFLGEADHPAPAAYFADNRVNSSFAPAEREKGAAARTLTDPWAGWDDERRRCSAASRGPRWSPWEWPGRRNWRPTASGS